MIKFIIPLLLVATVVQAQNPAPIILQNIPDGTYALTVKDGKATVAAAITATLSGPTPPAPTPTPIPTDQLIYDLIKALPETEARHQNAIKFAGTLKFVADQIKNGTLPPAAISRVWDPIMAVSVPDEMWKHIKKAALDNLGTNPTAKLEQFAAEAMQTVPNKTDPNVVRGTENDEIVAAAKEYDFDWSAILKILLPLLLSLLQNWLSILEIAATILIC